MLEDAFGKEFSEQDWEHALGGMHAIVREENEIVAHGAVVQRRLLHRDRPLRAGYVEGVGVRSDRRGRGYGSAIMNALEGVLRGAHEVGALNASDQGRDFYAARGWVPWQGSLGALAPDGVRRVATEQERVYVLELEVPLDPEGELICDYRDGDLW